MIRLGLSALACCALIGPVLLAQEALKFEIASVKPVESSDRRFQFTFSPDGAFRARLPLEWLIGIAWNIRPFERIIGEPGWARNDFFDIDAKPPRTSTRAEALRMLQALIEERFGLVWRRDPQGKATVYALVMAREDRELGPGIRRAEHDCLKRGISPPLAERQMRQGVPVPCGIAWAGEVMAGGSVAIGMIASSIQGYLGDEVVDRTQLTGNFDVYVQLPGDARLGVENAAGVSIFTAVEEQLGMKLQREEITRDVFVVERVAPPTPN